MDNCVTYYPVPTRQWGVIAKTRIAGMCAVTLTSDMTLGLMMLWSGHEFWECMHSDLGDMTLSQGHDKPLDHGQ